MGAHTHVHGHVHGHGPEQGVQVHAHGHLHAAPPAIDRRYALAIVLNLSFVALEFGAGLFSRSTALLADAGHNLSDVLGLALAGGAAWLAARGGGPRRTYGYGKATILAALANAVLLVLACGAIGWEALRRFGDPQEVQSGLVMGVAGAGVVLNFATALLFRRGREHDVNLRGAYLHMAADAAVSLGVVGAGLMIALTGAVWIDPMTSLVIVGVILVGTWGLLRESLDLALDAAPARLDMDELGAFLGSLPGVTAQHDVHVWNLSATETALTAHLVRAEPGDRAFFDEATTGLWKRFGIAHATLQVETDPGEACPDC
ncbi:MAG: cation diffusion facilitator family transporter [Pseudomonadota bacterium]|nr:cation diffusion facilitator family transporter [Pseudomonadota bacterium]